MAQTEAKITIYARPKGRLRRRIGMMLIRLGARLLSGPFATISGPGAHHSEISMTAKVS